MTDVAINRSDRAMPVNLTVEQASAEPSPNAQLVVRILRIAKRRKWLLLGSVAAALIIGFIITLFMTPQYTARATLEIQRETNRIVEVRGVQQESGQNDIEFYQTQYGLLRAQSLAERVATNMRLYENAAFFQMFGNDTVAAAIREGRRVSAAERRERVRAAAGILLTHIDISPTRLSRLVDVAFTSPDPSFSAEVVNAWTRHFVEMTLARRFEATAYARRFLEQRLEQLRRRLEESERTLVAYAAAQRIVNISTTTTSAAAGGQTTSERSLVSEDLATLNQALNVATAERIAAEARLRSSGRGSTESLQNPSIGALRGRRAELAGEYARLTTQFDPEYPQAQALRNQIRDLDRSIAREESRVTNTAMATFQAARAREESLRARVQGLQRDLIDLRGRTIQYTIYQREVDTNRQLYDALLQRYREIGVSGGVGVNNISVVDPANVPGTPSSPRLIFNLLLSLLVGGLAGTGLALALEQIDEAISDPRDVETLLGLPLLGTIPRSESSPEDELGDRKSALVEAYLSAQTSLAFTTDHGVPRTLTVTSSRPSEGKTTTSNSLARSLGRTGRKVLLIDADMRSPSLHHIYGLTNDRGISNYLTGETDLDKLLHHSLPDNLSLMTAGPPPPNAAELLIGDRIAELIGELASRFDHVVFDVPPVMGLADTPLVASHVEGVVFVVESHATRASIARMAVDRLKDAQARVLGVLLTKFESKRAHYGYGYDYGYGYGEDSSKTESA